MKKLILFNLPLIGILTGVVACTSLTTEVANKDRIQPYSKNSYYWQFQGEPILLLGGSDDDNLFQIPELKSHLEAIKAAGGNYIRNTMSDRKDKGFEVYPFKRLPDGKYDLRQWHDEYWQRFENMLKMTSELNIIVQLELWDRFDYTDYQNSLRWQIHPYNPKNNTNYTYKKSGFNNSYTAHPGANNQPFFFTTPEQQNNKVVLPHQQRFIDKVMSYTLQYNHILYCLDNETSASAVWASYWANYIRNKANLAGEKIYITEMWDDRNLQGEQHQRTLKHPEQYDFVDASQNNHKIGLTHWENFQWLRNYIAAQPRPLNTVKTYGADYGKHGNSREGIERWWKHLLGGAASVRFHRPPAGLGLSPQAIASIRSARKLESLIKPWEIEPADHLLNKRQDNEAYLAAREGSAYALYFTNGGSVELNLSGHPGNYQINWVQIETGQGNIQETFTADSAAVTISTPGKGGWIAAIVRISVRIHRSLLLIRLFRECPWLKF